MTIHKQRTTDRGSAHAGSKDRPKRKPQAYITRDSNGEYDIRAEDGIYLACAGKSTEAYKWCFAMGFTPIRNHHGDAPKTK